MEATYNFWSNETYSGRAPSRIIGTSVENAELAGDHLRLVQSLEWQSPPQRGALDGAVVARETRTIDVYPGQVANIIDIRSQLRSAKWDIRIGPTVHAYFTVRLARRAEGCRRRHACGLGGLEEREKDSRAARRLGRLFG